MGKLFQYQIFGLNISSELFLSGINESSFLHTDLYIREGCVPAAIDDYKDRGVFYYAAPGKFLFEMNSVGRFYVTEGKEIIVEKCDNADDKEINLFLLGSVMGAAILQRGLIPLHGSAILKDDKTMIVCGKSGAGKSSLAAEFIQRGFSLVSDDIAVFEVQKEMIVVKKGIQQLKLWADAMKSLELDGPTYSRVRPTLEKYYLPFPDPTVPTETELTAIVILEVKNSSGYSFNELIGVEKFEYVRSNIYRGIYIEPLALTAKTFKTISTILDKAKVFRVVRPITPLNIKELASFIESNLEL